MLTFESAIKSQAHRRILINALCILEALDKQVNISHKLHIIIVFVF